MKTKPIFKEITENPEKLKHTIIIGPWTISLEEDSPDSIWLKHDGVVMQANKQKFIDMIGKFYESI